MNQQNPYGGQQPQWGQPQGGGAWGQQPQQQQQQWGQQQPGMHPGMQMPGQGPTGPSYGSGRDESNMIASEASVEARSKFIERTYMHLAGAIALFVVLSAGFQMMPNVGELSLSMVNNWWMVLGGFILVSWIADWWARGDHSPVMQYAGLLLYTVIEAVIFVPMLYIASIQIGTEGIMTAGGVTLAMFAGLTAYVFVTKKDFSAWRGILMTLSFGALGLIGASMVFGFTLGIAFSIGMVVLAAGYILYYTGNVLHHYRVNQHVAAALALFSAVALLFWYILRIFLSRD
jgi:FtsH-binding integral membrane protein